MQLFAGLEADCLPRGNGDLCAGSWIAAYTGLAGLNGEDAKAAQLNAVALAERFFHGLEDGIDGGFRLDAGKPGAFDNSLDEVLLDQDGSPLLVPKQIWYLPVTMAARKLNGRKGVLDCQRPQDFTIGSKRGKR